MEVPGRRMETYSEELHSLLCIPCQGDGKQLEAAGYCKNCSEHLCKQCYKYHKLLTVTKHHVLVGKSLMPLVQTSVQSAEVCTDICTIHAAKYIEYFCAKHNQLACHVCLNLDHSDCKGHVSYIPDVASNVENGDEYKYVTKRLREMKTAAEGIKEETNYNMTSSKQDGKEAMSEMLQVKEDMKIFIDHTVDAMQDKFKSRQEEGMHMMEKQADRCSKVISATDQFSSELQYKANQRVALFVALKQGKARLDSFEDDIAKLEQEAVVRKYKFVPNEKTVTMLKDQLVDLFSVERATQSVYIHPHYFAHIGREVKVIHESGIVLYDTNSSTIPVGQFISCRPMTKDNNNLSIRVLCTGNEGTIALGLVPKNYPPDRQPGWNAQSIAYHADDGGIFLESGLPTHTKQPCKAGDIMSLYIDFDKNKGFFRKNGEKMIELNLNPSRLAFYPCIGMHSVGEAVQILEKELWTPQKEEERNVDIPALSTYKYGNLWISPGKKVTLTNLGGLYNGWVVLHNPKRDSVGYKVTAGTREEDIFYGVLEHTKDWLHHFELEKERLPNYIIVEWSPLESRRNYTRDAIKLLLGPIEEQAQQRSHRHRLLVSTV